jgi:hypothetical protein
VSDIDEARQRYSEALAKARQRYRETLDKKSPAQWNPIDELRAGANRYRRAVVALEAHPNDMLFIIEAETAVIQMGSALVNLRADGLTRVDPDGTEVASTRDGNEVGLRMGFEDVPTTQKHRKEALKWRKARGWEPRKWRGFGAEVQQAIRAGEPVPDHYFGLWREYVIVRPCKT